MQSDKLCSIFSMKWLATTLLSSSISILCAQHTTIQLTDIDIKSFWHYYDQFKNDTTQNPFSEYVETASPAMKKYADRWDNVAYYFKRNIREHQAYFQKRRNNSFDPQQYETRILGYFEQFKVLYPEAEAPKIFFVGGALTTLCHSNSEGILIAADVFADSAYRLNDEHKSLTFDELPIRTAQCIIRYNSRTAHIGHNLLREAIVEGSVQFITTLISEDVRKDFLNGKTYQYGESHEESLVKEFLQRKYDSDFSGWSHWSDGTDRPTGLATWIGYKITEAYYLNTADHQKAIKDILEINDFEKFLALSGYTLAFTN